MTKLDDTAQNLREVTQKWIENRKINALAKFLEEDKSEIEAIGDEEFEFGNATYLVLDDDEADEKVIEQCKNDLWAFKSSFIMSWLPDRNIMYEFEYESLQKSIDQAQENLCEGANSLIQRLLGDNVEDMINDAIGCDGRGHFLSLYDGSEYDEEVDGETYYIYRT